MQKDIDTVCRRVAIYIRVSTNEQATEGYSIPEQKERCAKYCDAMGYTVTKVYTDPGFSGSNIDRPAMKQLISDCMSGYFDIVLVHKLDRLSRSQKDTLYLIEDIFLKNNVSFISMSENFDTSSPFGRAMIGILSVFAQLEREQIKERMEMGRIGAAKMGKWRGGSGVPIGYDYAPGDDGVLTVNEYESAQITELYSMWLKGLSSHEICRRLREKGYTTKYGAWNNPSVIPDIATNPIYIGMQRYSGQIFPGLQKAIISEETFMAAESEFRRRKSNITENQRTAWRGKNLLSGLLFCGVCGARYFVTNITRTIKGTDERAVYKYYKCYTRDGNKKMRRADHCNNKTWRMEYLDNLVLDEIRKISYDADKLSSSHETGSDDNRNAVEERITNIDKQINSLIDLYQIDGIPLEEVGHRISKLRSEKDALQSSVAISCQDEKPLSLIEAQKILKSAIKIIEAGGYEEKKNLVTKLIRKITVNYDEIEVSWTFA